MPGIHNQYWPAQWKWAFGGSLLGSELTLWCRWACEGFSKVAVCQVFPYSDSRCSCPCLRPKANLVHQPLRPSFCRHEKMAWVYVLSPVPTSFPSSETGCHSPPVP